ncbi:hypothetical protein BDN70DRAFT_924635 [Pholiota conissans]|uniref:Uncharacterized protein n=1 Tax=Pholiota conissans TaxID=109636 RepID=A0A9P5YUW7_9AGAR|nr:hypothetical protein BDN70DRAFT_924635 [Pholiota conissans]
MRAAYAPFQIWRGSKVGPALLPPVLVTSFGPSTKQASKIMHKYDSLRTFTTGVEWSRWSFEIMVNDEIAIGSKNGVLFGGDGALVGVLKRGAGTGADCRQKRVMKQRTTVVDVEGEL